LNFIEVLRDGFWNFKIQKPTTARLNAEVLLSAPPKIWAGGKESPQQMADLKTAHNTLQTTHCKRQNENSRSQSDKRQQKTEYG
jgi:hypothetical protein